MILPKEIEEAVAHQFQSLRGQVEMDSGLTRYDTEGGEQSERPWRTTGFFVPVNEKSRLVLEVFVFGDGEIAIVRVYQERRLKIMFARKLSGHAERLVPVLTNASEVFRAAMPQKPFQETALDTSGLPEELRATLAHVLLPIPPPMNIGNIEEG